ncbi:hypothetical protein BGZ80_004662, partial [Entomortierella chlamydospora]
MSEPADTPISTVIIVGAGLDGLILGAILETANISYHILERASELRSLVKTGWHMLRGSIGISACHPFELRRPNRWNLANRTSGQMYSAPEKEDSLGDNVTPDKPFCTTQKVVQTPLVKMNQRSIGPPMALAPLRDNSVRTWTGTRHSLLWVRTRGRMDDVRGHCKDNSDTGSEPGPPLT